MTDSQERSVHFLPAFSIGFADGTRPLSLVLSVYMCPLSLSLPLSLRLSLPLSPLLTDSSSWLFYELLLPPPPLQRLVLYFMSCPLYLMNQPMLVHSISLCLFSCPRCISLLFLSSLKHHHSCSLSLSFSHHPTIALLLSHLNINICLKQLQLHTTTHCK